MGRVLYASTTWLQRWLWFLCRKALSDGITPSTVVCSWLLFHSCSLPMQVYVIILLLSALLLIVGTLLMRPANKWRKHMHLLMSWAVNMLSIWMHLLGWLRFNASIQKPLFFSSNLADICHLGCRAAIESNEQHGAEVASARNVAEDDATRNSKDIHDHCESKLQFIFLIIS